MRLNHFLAAASSVLVPVGCSVVFDIALYSGGIMNSIFVYFLIPFKLTCLILGLIGRHEKLKINTMKASIIGMNWDEAQNMLHKNGIEYRIGGRRVSNGIGLMLPDDYQKLRNAYRFNICVSENQVHWVYFG